MMSFFNRYISFTDTHYPSITNYYSNVSDISPTIAFNELAWLNKEYKKIIDVIILNSSSLDNYEFWALVEYVEDIGSALETASRASKWMRSAVTSEGYKQQIVTEFMTSQGQSLEDVERISLKSNDPRESWVKTALENQLAEDDYTLEGGYLINVIFKNNASLSIDGIIDNIDTADKTYGLDIDQNIAFKDDDLVVLNYKDTMFQSADILVKLGRGDDPAYPDRGVDIKSIVGSNIAAISYPSIFRQLAGNFATDDSFKAFTIKDIKRVQDAVHIEFQVQTKAGDVFTDYIQV